MGSTAQGPQGERERETLANLYTLDLKEMTGLRELLTQGPPRLEVRPLTVACSMMEKGVLVPVHLLGGLTFICEVHPVILKHRDAILARLQELPREGV